MKNTIYGYARVSTTSQNLDRQLDALRKYGVDKVYNEKITGTRKDRPELDELIRVARQGDTIVVESLSRLGRSTKDLSTFVEYFDCNHINFISLKESIDTSTSTGKLLFTLMSAIAQFERDVIADRTREGLAAARARGHFGGRPPVDKLAMEKAQKLYYTRQYTISEITQLTGITKPTLYRYINKTDSAS